MRLGLRTGFTKAPTGASPLRINKPWRSHPALTTSLAALMLIATAAIGLSLMPEAHAYSANAFVMVVKTDNPGTSNATSFTIPTTGAGYSYSVDCNNDGINEVTARTTSYTCVYGAAGTYTIAITGTFPRVYFNNDGDRQKLLEVKQWGTGVWTSMASAFYGCSNMHVTATDAPNLSGVTDMSQMFYNATSMNENINSWNVSHVTNMSYLFAGGWWDGLQVVYATFNQSLDTWNTSAVTNMSGMFNYATAFNQPLSSWNTSAVTNMSSMFQGATSMNQNINSWDVSHVKNMNSLFYSATAFNQPLSSWNTSAVTNMEYMFFYATAFNQPLANFNTSAVTTMRGMFWMAYAFNQPLANFNTSKVTDMSYMFDEATAFNQPLANFNTSAVTDMSYMFAYDTAFNQPIGNWDTSMVTNMFQMFLSVSSFDQPLANWNTSKVTSMGGMFLGATAFNQPLATWNTSAVTNMNSMFYFAATFNQPIGGWNTSAVTDLSGIFQGASAFDQPIGAWDVSKVTYMNGMFWHASAFNQPIGSWNTSAVTGMSYMFSAATAFDQPLGAWDVSKVTDMTSMFDDSHYPRTIYEQTLAGWALQTLKPNVPLGAAGVCYYNTAAHNTLTSAPNNWTISDAGVCAPTITSPVSSEIINNSFQTTITGTSLPNAAIRLSIEGTDYLATTQSDGSFSYQVPIELANGSHAVTVSLLDGSNNVISTSSPVNFTIQYNPTVITAPASMAVVNTDQPTITGTTLPNHTLTIAVDGTEHSTTTQPDGSYSFKVPSALTNGWHQAGVRLLGTNNGTLAASPVSFYVHVGGNIAINGAPQKPTLSWSAVPDAPTGTMWIQAAQGATSFPARGGFGAASLNGRLWVIGGQGTSNTRLNDVWSSPDGVTWTQTLAHAPWSARNSHSVTAFNGKLWVMGGNTSGGFMNDIWSSTDGVTWTKEITNAPWSPRAGFKVVEYNNKLWLMGGTGSISGGGLNDVWNSPDGVNWTLVTGTAAWSVRNGFGAAAFNGKLWVMGGANGGSSPFTNDVWSSPDGITWTEETASADWPVRASLQVQVFDGKLWLLGGSAANWDSEYSDIWFSENGKDWIRTTEAADWTARRGHSSAVFNNKLWVLGGNVGSSWTTSNDVWSAAVPSVTYTLCWDTVQNGCAHTATVTDTNSFTVPNDLAKGTWYFSVSAAIPGASGAGTYASTPYQVTDPAPTTTPLTGTPIVNPLTGAPSTATLTPALAGATLAIASYDCSTVQAPSLRLIAPDNLTAPDTNVTLLGGVGFSVSCTSNGKSAAIALTLGTSYSDTTKLRAYKQSGTTLTDITNQVSFTNTVINGTTKTVLHYTLTDGTSLDEDHSANGTLVDPIFIGTLPGAGEVLADTGTNLFVVAAGAMVASLVGFVVIVRTLGRRGHVRAARRRP